MQVEFSSMKDFPPFLLLLAHPDEFHPGFSSGLDGIISYFTSLPCTAPPAPCPGQPCRRAETGRQMVVLFVLHWDQVP